MTVTRLLPAVLIIWEPGGITGRIPARHSGVLQLEGGGARWERRALPNLESPCPPNPDPKWSIHVKMHPEWNVNICLCSKNMKASKSVLSSITDLINAVISAPPIISFARYCRCSWKLTLYVTLSVHAFSTCTTTYACRKLDCIMSGTNGVFSSWNTMATMSLPMCLFLWSWMLDIKKNQEPVL